MLTYSLQNLLLDDPELDHESLLGPVVRMRWMSNLLRLAVTESVDQVHAAAGEYTEYEAEIRRLRRSSMAPDAGRFYPVEGKSNRLFKNLQPEQARQIIEHWRARQPTPAHVEDPDDCDQSDAEYDLLDKQSESNGYQTPNTTYETRNTEDETLSPAPSPLAPDHSPLAYDEQPRVGSLNEPHDCDDDNSDEYSDDGNVEAEYFDENQLPQRNEKHEQPKSNRSLRPAGREEAQGGSNFIASERKAVAAQSESWFSPSTSRSEGRHPFINFPAARPSPRVTRQRVARNRPRWSPTAAAVAALIALLLAAAIWRYGLHADNPPLFHKAATVGRAPPGVAEPPPANLGHSRPIGVHLPALPAVSPSNPSLSNGCPSVGKVFSAPLATNYWQLATSYGLLATAPQPNPFPRKALRTILLAAGLAFDLQYKFRYAPDSPARIAVAPVTKNPASTAMNALRIVAVSAIVWPLLAQVGVAAGPDAAPDAEGVRFFERKIRPVLVEHCYSCHSAAARDAKKLQAALFLDTAAGVAAGGESGPVIVKGKSAESTLLKALQYDGFEMPPAGKLSDGVIADFAKWIDMGAPDPRSGEAPVAAKREINVAEGRKWWSFQPLAIAGPLALKPSVPPSLRPSVQGAAADLQSPVAAQNNTSKAIDAYLVAAQQAQGIKPNHPASREKLIRRAYFDLIGLPPTPEQVAAFVADSSPDAYAKVVDSLLASPAYGERWARHWLDAARFAESNGYEFDAFRPGAYHYRDWVIRALNDDLPYDEFVRMQLAGDLLKPGDLQATAAAGFLVAGPYPGQITAKTVERIRYDQLDDMLMTVGGSMLGLTFGCVRCHDHKYDPIPQQDYYALAASLGRTVHGPKTMDLDPAATAAAQAKHDAEHAPFVAALEAFAAKELPKRFETWSKAELAKLPEPTRWQALEPVEMEAARSYLKTLNSLTNPAGYTIAHDGSQGPVSTARRRGRLANAGGAESYRLVFHTNQKNLQALRLDALTDRALPQRGPGLNNDGSFQLAEVIVTAKSLDVKSKEAPQTLKLKPVFAAFEDKDQGLKNAVDGKDNTAWVVKTTAKKDNGAIFEFEKPLAGFAGGTELTVELKFRDLGIGRLRVAVSTEPNPATWAGDSSPQYTAELRTAAAAGAKLPESLRVPLARWFAPLDADTAKVVRAERSHAAADPRPKLVEVYTTIAGGQDVFLLRRGEVDNKLGKADPGFVQVLMRSNPSPQHPSPQPSPRGTGAREPEAADVKPAAAKPAIAAQPAVDPRLALARQMTDVESGAGPLLARVMVNRMWQHHFGEGIVGTPNDFGVQGDRPSHPELLEYLAAELVSGGWRLKPLHRAMMLSDAYQQSHEVNPTNLKLDPTNRLLWHFRPRRLEAEMIRDSLLAVGGNLDAKLYGPSVLDDTTRRSVYLRVKRSELIPSMTMFDAPEPTQSIGERSVTTVPTQALAMMNSPFVRRQAEKLAERIRPTKDEPLETVIDRGYQVTFGRVPTDAERSQMKQFIIAQQAAAAAPVTADKPATAPAAKPAAATPAAGQAALDKALVEFCHVLLCLNEFVYVD